MAKGYAVQTGTQWLVSEHVGLSDEFACSFEELFDCEFMVQCWQTGKEGRPPLPGRRKGSQLLDDNQDLLEVMHELSWLAVEAKRQTNPEVAAEDEACTKPTEVLTTGPASFNTLVVDIRLCGDWSPGITGVTMNGEPLIDGVHVKLDKDGPLSLATRLPSTYRISSSFPSQAQGSVKAHDDGADKQERRVSYLGLKHSSQSVLLIWSHNPYKLMVGGEFNVGLADSNSKTSKSGASKHVSSHNSLLWVGHTSKF
mmetsp:Transcript_27979/g.56341  ORF Transcript_27979/g.56341 Transcript_27979/m.56341 type:complete len:255 (-) Transcript_27979:378-1142(-)